MIVIDGYKYITHKLINRPWGPECRYTVAKADGSHINDVVVIPSMKIEEKELTEIVAARLAMIDIEPEIIEPEQTYTATQVKELLIEKGYMSSQEKLEDLKPVSELVAKVSAVKAEVLK